MNAIEIQGLTKRYGALTAVDYLDLDIQKGELFALLGVNGAGKSTTIRMLSTLCTPTAGDAMLLGHRLSSHSTDIKSIIGVSPQETAIAPNLTTQENLEFLCGIHGLSKPQSEERIAALCQQFSLQSILSRKAGKLSGGWQRRVSIAMALIAEPQILFLDEPTLGLDVIARHELWETIRSMKGKVTIILTTHYMEEAESLSDRIGIMKNGTLLAVGTAEELKKRAGADRFEAAFVSFVKEGA